ncbi:MAG: hypothetical protein JWM36_4215 [Hyphomicrobiales bacterium]|nr:hypothetical protein [Hyphomicrobiales bacterium]
MRIWLSGPRFFRIHPSIGVDPDDARAMRGTPSASSGKNQSAPRLIPIIMLWIAMVLVAVFFHDAGAPWVGCRTPYGAGGRLRGLGVHADLKLHNVRRPYGLCARKRAVGTAALGKGLLAAPRGRDQQEEAT